MNPRHTLSIAAILLICAAGTAWSETPRSAVPDALVGRWMTSSGTGSSYADPSTGAHSAPNSSQFSYQFYDNGTFEHAALIQSSLYNCSMSAFGYEAGTLVITETTLTVYPQTATFRSADTCVAENNYEKPGDMSVVEYQWRLERDADTGGLVLTLVWPTGFEEVFHPVAISE